MIFRPNKARLLFNTVEVKWEDCMRKCLKYNRATAPAIGSPEEFDDLSSWTFNTTTEPMTGEQYPDSLSQSFWLPFM